MPRGPSFAPSNCPWAALAARGMLTTSRASQYRSGAAVPGASTLRAMRALGYPVEVITDANGGRRAVCATWPERLPEWAAPVLADCAWAQPSARVLDAALRAVLVSGQLGDWHAEVLSVAPDGVHIWPRAAAMARASRAEAEAAAEAEWAQQALLALRCVL